MKAVSVHPLDGFRLGIRFENGFEGEVDISDMAGRGVMSGLKERQVFESVRVTAAGALEWPGGIDICGDSLYLKATGLKPGDLFPKLTKSENAGDL